MSKKVHQGPLKNDAQKQERKREACGGAFWAQRLPKVKGGLPRMATPPLPPRTPPSQLRTLREQGNTPAAAGKARAFRNITLYYVILCYILHYIILYLLTL